MADPKQPEDKNALTLADAAKLAKIPTEDCLAFKDYGEYVVVVTVYGEKMQVDKSTGVISVNGEEVRSGKNAKA